MKNLFVEMSNFLSRRYMWPRIPQKEFIDGITSVLHYNVRQRYKLKKKCKFSHLSLSYLISSHYI